MRTLIVTGASGYVGRHLAARARACGWHVVAASRREAAGAEWLPYRLEASPDPERFPREATIVHLAARTSGPADPGVEIGAARALVEAAQVRACAMLFVSSQAARHDAPSSYGRTKHAIERHVLAAGGVVVRPGLVWGGAPAGLYARLLRVVRTLRVWPAVVPAPVVQPVHVDDLADVLLRLAETPTRYAGRVLHIGEGEPISFAGWLQALAASRSRRLWLVPVPATIVSLGAAVVERLGGAALAARARSLIAIEPMATAANLAEIGVVLRRSRDLLARRARGRTLVREGACLLRYALGEPAGAGLVRRYVRAIATLRDGEPLEQTRRWRVGAAQLRLRDQPALRHADAELRWRLQAAAAIAEASRQGARAFIFPRGRARGMRMVAALATLGIETVYRIASVPLAWAARAARRHQA